MDRDWKNLRIQPAMRKCNIICSEYHYSIVNLHVIIHIKDMHAYIVVPNVCL